MGKNNFKMLSIVGCGGKIDDLSLWYKFKIIYYESKRFD